ncbi:MAG TPA: helix-turn-helix transcriptional regulator [Candidatus Dormibacteraeota bacterium]|nr:helix-turn-helix transcriptional regulator [Candidatus Dormibacteraeota bacterium]
MGRAKIFSLLQPRLSQPASGNGHGDFTPIPQAPAAAASLRLEFPGWLREATGWQRIGRFVPMSWIVILVWPLTLLVTRGLPPVELAVSLLGLATFAVVWVWFWVEPRTGTDPWLSAGVLLGLGAIGAALTFSHPRIWHDGLVGYCMVVAAVWPSWRPALVAVPAVAVVVFLAITATGSGLINGFGVALVWLFLGFGFVAVQHLLRANLRLHEARVRSEQKASLSVVVAMAVSPRQREIMLLVATGLSDKEIAARLQVSPHTVRTHLQRLYAQHGLHNRAEAAATWTRGRPVPAEDANSV